MSVSAGKLASKPEQMSNSPISTAATGSLFKSGSTLEQSNDGNNASKHKIFDKPVSHARVDTGMDKRQDFPESQTIEIGYQRLNIVRPIIPAQSSRKHVSGSFNKLQVDSQFYSVSEISKS